MMTLLVFLVLIFGLFGVFSAQYIIQYREAYYIWTKEIPFKNNIDLDNSKKRELCSKIESYSREICELANMIILLFILLCITVLTILYTIEKNIPYISDVLQLNIIRASEFLTFLLFISIFVILHLMKISLWSPKSMTSAIDEKIFDVWFKLECHECKKDDYKKNKEPKRLYEITAEKLDNNEIEPSQELTELVKTLRKNIKVNTQA
ncbi:MAG: hypothetical protein WA102_05650 [Candidatus Methanoperedens sp.]